MKTLLPINPIDYICILAYPLSITAISVYPFCDLFHVHCVAVATRYLTTLYDNLLSTIVIFLELILISYATISVMLSILGIFFIMRLGT